MTEAALFKVEISLKRVQTFIFDVPRLKAMLGANALIGGTMRHWLARQAIASGAIPINSFELPGADPADPLQPKDSLDVDDPRALYSLGILARDGGHFSAVFPNADSAEDFQSTAEKIISAQLPGVLFDIDVRGLNEEPRATGARKSTANEMHLLELPVLQLCQETGQGLASQSRRRDGTDIWVAQSVQQRLEAGELFSAGKSNDMIGLMGRALGLTADSGWRAPDDLNDLCAGQYLALIHADGNGVGLRYIAWRNSQVRQGSADSILEREAHGERFFHSMRVAVRKAVVKALASTFVERGGTRPYAVLMLGGDDLLIACRADKSLPFARAYAAALKDLPLVDERPLDVGIGVAIAKSSYPLHRLHQLAEALASSAKRLYRADTTKGSVIDWQVVTNSWFDDVAGARRAADVRRYSIGGAEETVVLSMRPYPVLPGASTSLADLLRVADGLDEVGHTGEVTVAARSPLRALRSAFEGGRRSGEMAFARLDQPLRTTLVGSKDDSPWTEVADSHFVTGVLDIVGIREIGRLGRSERG